MPQNRLDDVPPRVRAIALAASQHGVIHVNQARALGLSQDAVYRLSRRDEWRRLLPLVYATSPDDGRQWAMAACLWGGNGAAASHRCAGELWELDGVPAGVLEITIAGRGRNSNGGSQFIGARPLLRSIESMGYRLRQRHER